MNSEKPRRNDRILISAAILSIATYFAARLLLYFLGLTTARRRYQ